MIFLISQVTHNRTEKENVQMLYIDQLHSQSPWMQASTPNMEHQSSKVC